MKSPHLRLGVFCFASAALYLPSPACAQQQPPTVSNIPAEQLRQPSRDEVGLWQLLSNQNNPNMVCGGGNKSLAVVKATGQVVCVSPTPAASNTQASPAVDPNTADKRSAALDKAEAEKQLGAAEAEEERIRSMHEKAEAAVKKAEATLESANKEADALQEKADATDDPQEKLSLLKEQLKLKKTMLPVVQQRDNMRETAIRLQGQLKQAEQQTALAKSELEKAKQATVVASRQQPVLPSQAIQDSGSTLRQNPSVSFGTPQLPTTPAQPSPSLPFGTTTANTTEPYLPSSAEQLASKNIRQIYLNEFASVPSEIGAALVAIAERGGAVKHLEGLLITKWAESLDLLPPLDSRVPVQYRIVAPWLPTPVEMLIRPGVAE